MTIYSCIVLIASIQSAICFASRRKIEGDERLWNFRNSQQDRQLDDDINFAFFNYEPKSIVTNEAAIDLDQEEIERELDLLSVKGNQNARAIYEFGAHSKSYAYIELNTAINVNASIGDAVVGYNREGKQINGLLLQDVDADSKMVRVEYSETSATDNSKNCMVGESLEPITDACFRSVGNVTIFVASNRKITLSYSYDQIADNRNALSLQRMSYQAKQNMYQCQDPPVNNCPYGTYLQFFNYYGDHNYANEYIIAAFGKRPTKFTNGNYDFSDITFVGRAETIKKSTVILNLWMHVINNLEHATDSLCDNFAPPRCETSFDNNLNATRIICEDKKFHHRKWDRAVAFFTGSLVLRGNNSSGLLFFGVGNEHCTHFNTCGPNGDRNTGVAKVNHDIFKQFAYGSNSISRYNIEYAMNQFSPRKKQHCNDLKISKEMIKSLMTVPLVQGVLQYAYWRGALNRNNAKNIALGSAYAASILPLIYGKCKNSNDANIIHTNMKFTNSGENNNIDFMAVKLALERNYKCLGISCEDVGNISDDKGIITESCLSTVSASSNLAISKKDNNVNNKITTANSIDKGQSSSNKEAAKYNQKEGMSNTVLPFYFFIGAFFLAIVTTLFSWSSWKISPQRRRTSTGK